MATDGGVVLKGCQGISIIGTDSRDIHIGISLQEYEAGLRRREQEVTQELEQVHEEERQLLETGKTEIERRLADVQASHQAYVQELEQRIAELEAFRGQVPEALLDEARAALTQGDRSRADNLFAQIEAKHEAAVLAVQATTLSAVEAAYQSSQIAKDVVRYRMAYEPARWAVQLAPDNSRYRSGAGELARILGDYRTAKVTIQLLQLGHWGAALEGQDERVEKIVGLFAES